MARNTLAGSISYTRKCVVILPREKQTETHRDNPGTPCCITAGEWPREKEGFADLTVPASKIGQAFGWNETPAPCANADAWYPLRLRIVESSGKPPCREEGGTYFGAARVRRQQKPTRTLTGRRFDSALLHQWENG